jgi:hypothetical protein
MQNLLQGGFLPIDATSENWEKKWREKGTKNGGNGEIINTLCRCSRVMLEEWGVPETSTSQLHHFDLHLKDFKRW